MCLCRFVEDYKGGKLQPVGSDWEVQGDENKNEVSSVDKHDELLYSGTYSVRCSALGGRDVHAASLSTEGQMFLFLYG